VMSFVARNLEPVRGFHMLMRTLPELQRRRPKAHVIIVGGDELSYGKAAPGGVSWRDHMLAEVGDRLDMRRIHFVGKVPYQAYLYILQISRVHAYWTTPFVLSWSFLEAAMSGLPVVASDTPPVMEFAQQLGVKTVGFFDAPAYIEALAKALAKKNARREPFSLPELELEYCLREQKRVLMQTI
ncbi:MAG: glycosyltransferase, partial [Burkholderiaceae bacterium]|nr:glycosyltransferase [Burkholderiaceae bacterium]